MLLRGQESAHIAPQLPREWRMEASLMWGFQKDPREPPIVEENVLPLECIGGCTGVYIGQK